VRSIVPVVPEAEASNRFYWSGGARVKTSFVVFAVIAAFSAFGLGSVVADPLDSLPSAVGDELPPYEVMNIVRSSGMRPMGPPARRGRIYLLHAVERNGDDVRVVVDARSGRIVSVTPMMDFPPPSYGASSAYEPAPMDEPTSSYGRPGPYHYGPPEPLTGRIPNTVPPELAPAARPASPVSRSAAVTPPRTPLPRPRPAETVAAVPTDLKTTAPEPSAQTPPVGTPVSPADKSGTSEAKSADKPAATVLPPVTPLD
jgi:hypothetical protein